MTDRTESALAAELTKIRERLVADAARYATDTKALDLDAVIVVIRTAPSSADALADLAARLMTVCSVDVEELASALQKARNRDRRNQATAVWNASQKRHR